FPRQGPSVGGCPCVAGTTGSSDFLPPIPPRLVAFAWRYRPALLVRSSRERSAAPGGLGWCTGRPAPLRHCDGGDRISQVPGGPIVACRALRPRRDRHVSHGASAPRRFGVAFRDVN